MTETEIVDPYNAWHRGVLFVDEGRTFYQNRSFRFFIGLPIVFGLAAYVALFFGPDSPWAYPFEFSPKGYATALAIVKFPIYMLTLAIGAGVMVARMHRSKVVNRSIEVAERNNNFMQRAKHEEEFLKFAGSIPRVTTTLDQLNQLTFTLDNTHDLYKVFFPKNTTHIENLSPSFNVRHEIVKQICCNLEAGLTTDDEVFSAKIPVDFILRYFVDAIPVVGKLEFQESQGVWVASASHDGRHLFLLIPYLLRASVDFVNGLEGFMNPNGNFSSVSVEACLERYAPSVWLAINKE